MLFRSINEEFGQLSLERTCQRVVRPPNVTAPPPSAVIKLTQEQYDRLSRLRDACDHKRIEGSALAGRSAIIRHACGRAGTFQHCQMCDRRWRWHTTQRVWEIYDKDAVEAGLIPRYSSKPPSGGNSEASSRAPSRPSSQGSQHSAPSSRLPPEPDATRNRARPQSTSAASTAAAPATRVAATTVVDEDGFRRITRRARFIASISSDTEKESPIYAMDWSQVQATGAAPSAASYQQQEFNQMMQQAEQAADQSQHLRNTELAEEYQCQLRQLQSQQFHQEEQLVNAQRQYEAEVIQQRAYLEYQNQHLQRQHLIITEQEQAQSQANDPQLTQQLQEQQQLVHHLESQQRAQEHQTHQHAQERLLQFEQQQAQRLHEQTLHMEEVHRYEQIRYEEQLANQQHVAEMAVQQHQAQQNIEVVQLRGMLSQLMSQTAPPQAALPPPMTPGPMLLPHPALPTPRGLPAALSTGMTGTVQARSTTPLDSRPHHHALPVPVDGTTPKDLALEDGQTDQEWVVTPGKSDRSEL